VPTLILLRHGQSEWNLANRFTGWVDVDLTELGVAEGLEAGRLLAAAGHRPDVVHTSLQKRAIRTAELALGELDRRWIPVRRSWRLNERHYGALQGLDKAETAAQHGEAQVKIWRRSYDIPPPALALDDPRHPRHDLRYAGIDPALLPATESLKDTLARVQPFWESRIAPELRSGRNVLVTAHGNSLRAMVKMLDNVPEKDIVELNIPTGVPLLYELDEQLRPLTRRYLGDAAAIQAAADAVRRQTERN
jgi:2,3-bisphosphoglycerate-dependent phosphoglycerate mutase